MTRRGELAGLGQLWSLVTPGGGGYSLHLSVTWSRLESGLGAYKCKEGTRNQFVTGFEKVPLTLEEEEIDVYASSLHSKYYTHERL